MKRKIFIFALVAILVVGGGVIFLWTLGNKTLQDQELAAQGFKKIDQPDSDGDGLADWEEELWETDPQKSDTDGDGTSDGEEIKARRDPRRAGPNDQLKTSNEQLEALVHSAIEKKQAPIVIAPPEMVAARQAIPSAAITIAQVSPESYGQNLTVALKPYLLTHQSNMARELTSFLTNNQTSHLTTINLANNGIATSLKALPSVSVPAEIASSHRAFVEHLVKVGELLGYMSKAATEPIVAVQAGQVYQYEYAQVIKFLLEINAFLIKNNVKLDASSTPPILINY